MKNLARAARRHHRLRLKLRVLNFRFIGEKPDHYWLTPWPHRWRYDYKWFKEGPLYWMSESGHRAFKSALMTKPSRAKEHQALRLILRGVAEEVAIRRWPDHKKPYIYYW